jgi:hypothetical protein
MMRGVGHPASHHPSRDLRTSTNVVSPSQVPRMLEGDCRSKSNSAVVQRPAAVLERQANSFCWVKSSKPDDLLKHLLVLPQFTGTRARPDYRLSDLDLLGVQVLNRRRSTVLRPRLLPSCDSFNSVVLMFTRLDAKRLSPTAPNLISAAALVAGNNVSTCPAVLALFDDRG